MSSNNESNEQQPFFLMNEGNSSLLEVLWKEAVLFLPHSCVLKGSGSVDISQASKVVSAPLKESLLKNLGTNKK
jgi:hypothetical protein